MVQKQYKNIELGNLGLGNSRGNFEILDRMPWQYKIWELLELLPDNDFGHFENEIFIINPYYWGDEEEEKVKSNFIYKNPGFTIDWYKHPLRDSYMSHNITFEEFTKIIEDCIKSIK